MARTKLPAISKGLLHCPQKCPHKAWILKLLGSHAISNLFYRQGKLSGIAFDKMLQHRGACGGQKLPVCLRKVNRHSLDNLGSCRSRNRQYPMGAAHCPISHADRGGQNLIYSQHLHCKAASCYIHQCIQRAHLVEMDLLHRSTVYLALRLPDPAVNLCRIPAHLLTYRQRGDPLQNLRVTGVVVAVGMIMTMNMLLVIVAMAVLVTMTMGMSVTMLVRIVIMAVPVILIMIMLLVIMTMAVLVLVTMLMRIMTMAMLMTVVMHMFILLLPMHTHMHLDSADPLLGLFLSGHGNAFPDTV